jgi:hypothetical protein
VDYILHPIQLMFFAVPCRAPGKAEDGHSLTARVLAPLVDHILHPFQLMFCTMACQATGKAEAGPFFTVRVLAPLADHILHPIQLVFCTMACRATGKAEDGMRLTFLASFTDNILHVHQFVLFTVRGVACIREAKGGALGTRGVFAFVEFCVQGDKSICYPSEHASNSESLQVFEFEG